VESILFSSTIFFSLVSNGSEEFRPMRSAVVPALSFFCLFTFLPVSNAQTKPKHNQLLPYGDTDGYQVLSSIIDARTKNLRNEPVSIFYRTVSEEAFREVRLQCSTSFPREFQGALDDFDKKAKTKFLLQRQFSIQKKYRFVETEVDVETSTESLAGTYSVSVVGFDESRTHAIVLVECLVRPGGSIVVGGDTTFYLLRRTANGWQAATDIRKCGRIY
jgi:hypothetical protein